LATLHRNYFASRSFPPVGNVIAAMTDSPCKPSFGTPVSAAAAVPRVRLVNRDQLVMLNTDVDRLIPEDHAARAIWEFVGRLELGPFYEKVKAVEGQAGQPPFDPRLMISIWVYGLSRGISSARELSEWCDWEPGLQWLCGLESVNYHSLSTFRAAHGEALKKLFIEVLGVLSAEGLVGLERVTVDGTRIRAQASNESFRQGKRLQEYLAQAAAHVEALEKEPEETIGGRQQAARERSRRERQERLAAARQLLEQLQQDRGESKASEVQVSVTEAEARIMKQPGGGFGPNYNLQLATDGQEKIIVAAVVSASGTDMHLLAEVLDEVKSTCGKLPEEVLVDGGYVSADNLDQSRQRDVELIGPAPDVTAMVHKQAQRRGVSEAYFKEAFTYEAASDTYCCPEGKTLIHIKQRSREGGRTEHEYRAKHSDCAACAHKMECCPTAKTCGRTVVRSEPNPLLQEFREKMQTEAYRQQYRKRSEVAEFPNAWLKEKLGIRRFRLRGRAKVALESLWAVITYNLQQWIRLRWRKQVAAA
jgi:transposase